MNRNWSKVDEIPGPNNRLDAQTPFSANLGFDHKFASPPLAIGGNFAFKTAGTVRISPTQATYTWARRNLDLYAVYRFSPAVQLRFTATNLLAQDFLNVASFFDSAGGTLQYATATPTYRRLGLSLELKL
jgi:outer membrane receptor for ferrienterochelin and colicins